MYLLFFLLISYCTTFLCTQEQKTTTNYDPLLVVVLMVKDEEQFIQKTLQPFLDAGINAYIILDTGSQDKTITIVQELFKKHNITHGHIIEKPFIDFATSRNYALECAEQIFQHAHFFIMIDAEWYIQNLPALLTFCANNVQNQTESFSIRVTLKNNEYYVRRLFKGDKKIRFVGAVHEYAQTKTSQQLPPEMYIIFDCTENGIEKSRLRWQKDIDILLKEHEKNPENARTLFYLGQTYQDLQDYDNAITWYIKRINAQGWQEEQLLASYRLAQIYDYLDNWPIACYYYIYTYNLNPKRAESLIALAKHYLKTHDYHMSYLFAQQAYALPYPTDAVIVDKKIYDYERYIIFAIAAWYVQQYDIGLQALTKALNLNPNDECLLQNLELFQQTMTHPELIS